MRRIEKEQASVLEEPELGNALPDPVSAVLGGMGGVCLCAVLVLLVIDWRSGLHNALLTLGLCGGAFLFLILAVARPAGARTRDVGYAPAYVGRRKARRGKVV